MANKKNLLKGNKDTQFRTGREQVEIARKGGIASGEARRAKKSMAERANLMLNMALSEKQKSSLKTIAAEAEDDSTIADLMIAGQIKSAVEGNTKAFNALQQLSDSYGKDDDAKKYELPARVVGKAFVDINRKIEPNKKNVFKGGRGATKSSYISLKIIELLKNNSNMHACIVRKVKTTLKDSVYAQIKWAIKELGLYDDFDYKVSPLEITHKKTGQKIYFRGCDDPIKLKSIKPEFGYIGILWIEELDQLDGPAEMRSVEQSVLRGGIDSYEFCSYNPPKSKNNWVNKEELIPDDNREIHYSTYLDTPTEWLGQKFINDAEHLKEVNQEAYEHEYLGIANGEGGNVFEYLELRTISDEEIESFDRIYQGVDWGWYPDIYAFVRIHLDEAHKKIYFIDENTGNKIKNSISAQWIIDKEYDDFPITCDSSENKSINDYKDAGLPAKKAIKGPGSVEYGMKYLQGYTIVIDRNRTPKAYEEFTKYEYERDKDGNVISGYPDKDNHTIDATRYALEQNYNSRGVSA